MDPVDPESVHQALNAQGNLIGRHDQMLKEAIDSLEVVQYLPAQPSDQP